jgi:hypothetical protein
MNNTEQPHYYEPLLRFDMYSVVWKDGEWQLVQMFKDMSWLAAEIVAGVEHSDFTQSIEHTGWLGSCPEWCGFKPVITVPRGDTLGLDQLNFAVEILNG